MKYLLTFFITIMIMSCASPNYNVSKTSNNWIDPIYLDTLVHAEAFNKMNDIVGYPVVTEKIGDTLFAYYHYYPFMYKTSENSIMYKPHEKDNVYWDFSQHMILRLNIVKNKVITYHLLLNDSIPQHFDKLIYSKIKPIDHYTEPKEIEASEYILPMTICGVAFVSSIIYIINK